MSPDIRRNAGDAGTPAWGDAGVIIPWTGWKMYGDTAILDRHFGVMTRWMDFLERAYPELLATAYWAHDAALMAEIAEAAGRAGQAAGYRALGGKLRSSFINAFVDGDGQVASGTQAAYVLALPMHLRPGDL